MKYFFLISVALGLAFFVGACGENVDVSHLLNVRAENWNTETDQFVSGNVLGNNYAIRLTLDRQPTHRLSSSTGAILNRDLVINAMEFITITALQKFESRPPDSSLNDLFGIGTTLLDWDSLSKQNEGNYYDPYQTQYYLTLLKKTDTLVEVEFIVRIKTRQSTDLQDTTSLIRLQ